VDERINALAQIAFDITKYSVREMTPDKGITNDSSRTEGNEWSSLTSNAFERVPGGVGNGDDNGLSTGDWDRVSTGD
jgi:hypothetical protein